MWLWQKEEGVEGVEGLEMGAGGATNSLILLLVKYTTPQLWINHICSCSQWVIAGEVVCNVILCGRVCGTERERETDRRKAIKKGANACVQ